MTGLVDAKTRAVLSISVKAIPQSQATSVEAWIDTGFSGEWLRREDA